MPTVVSETWSWPHSGLSSIGPSSLVEIVVIVVVVGIFVVLVREILTVKVVGECVAARFLVFPVGHTSNLRGRRH